MYAIRSYYAETVFERLEGEARRELQDHGFSPQAIDFTRFLNLRYHGTDTAIMIPRPEDNDYTKAFRTVYRREFGFDLFGREILIDDIRIRARGRAGGVRRISVPKAQGAPPVRDTAQCYFEDGWQKTLIYDLEKLSAGHCVAGPAILIHHTSTILIEPDCTAAITQSGDVEITVGSGTRAQISTEIDPVQLSIFSNLFMSIAEQMGRMLQKTAISTNIKERLDFSCALFGPNGELVANAPHLPVHLGSMSDAVKAQIRRQGSGLTPGNVLVSNHPAAGGSHLPDITVITPVFKDEQVIFWVAARGHHADIGGISPGSMPPNSRRLEEEGAS